MSFILDLVDYIASQTTLVVDTDLFLADELDDSPDACVTVSSSPGSFRNESGIDMQAVQILVKDTAFITTETRALEVFNLLANKPGFGSLGDVFYSEVLNAPFPVDRDERGRYIFSMNLIIRKRS